jgi:Flp pilus assembly protein TadG
MLPLFRRFMQREDGNVAMTFAVAALPIILLAGAAMDYSRASSLGAKLQADLDATTLALCRSTSTSTADLTTKASGMLADYSPDQPVTVDSVSLVTMPRSVTLKGHVTYQTAFMQLAGIKTVNVPQVASCTAGETFYEIALVLDTTGSMANSSGGVSKLAALKTAATNFVNTMFDSIDSQHLKISLVPFAASVKVDPITYANATWLDQTGKSSLHWQNVTGASAAGFSSRFDIFKKLAKSYSGWAWEGCLESLPYPLNVQDVAPTPANPDSYYLPLFAPDEIGNSGTSTGSYNSYMDDGTSSRGTCQSDDTDLKRLGQACKYATPTNITKTQPGPNFMCDARPLTRLTNTKATLLSEINALTAAGNTDIHEGLMWGWRTISPNSVFADGAAYTSSSTTRNTVKIVVLMSDGENTWSYDSNAPLTKSYYSAYGFFNNANGQKPDARLPPANASPNSATTSRAAIDALTTEACTNVKAASIKLYSVAFSVASDPIDAAGQTLLKNCASSANDYFLASDSAALNKAFGSIADGIGQLRLTK